MKENEKEIAERFEGVPFILDKTIPNYRGFVIKVFRGFRPCYNGGTSAIWKYQVGTDEPKIVGRRTFAIAQAGRDIDFKLDGTDPNRFDFISGRKTSWDDDYKRVMGRK